MPNRAEDGHFEWACFAALPLEADPALVELAKHLDQHYIQARDPSVFPRRSAL